MSAPKTYKSEAIVLKHIDLGEADRILTLYTPNHGKVRAVARGVRKIKSRLAGHVEPVTHCSLMLARGRSLEVISQGQIIDSFALIRSDLRLTAQALYLMELTDSFTSEHVENYPMYRLLLESLRSLCSIENVEILFRYFELQLLEHVGYRPQLHQCINCRKPLNPVENFFSPSGGGILCPDCSHNEPEAKPISVNALKVMRLLQRGDYITASHLQLTSELSRELERTVQVYIRYLLERELKSPVFINRLKRYRIY